MDNQIKFEVYKSMKCNLKRAMNAEFYYEAIFIEYAITEDRLASVLRHAGVKYLDNKGNEIKISEKIKKVKGNPIFDSPFVRKRMPIDFLDELTLWKRDRDALIHDLAKIPYNHEKVKQIAERGQVLVKRLDNAVKSINKHFSQMS